MSTRHTPGPWRVAEALDGTMTEVMAGDIYIAPAVWQASVVTDKQQREREANARLIAAAPELLEALEWMLNAHDDGIFSGGCIAFSRTAIAKAKGGSK